MAKTSCMVDFDSFKGLMLSNTKAGKSGSGKEVQLNTPKDNFVMCKSN